MKEFRYDYSGIEEASGRGSVSVRSDVSRGVFNPDSLLSVSLYVATNRLKGISVDALRCEGENDE